MPYYFSDNFALPSLAFEPLSIRICRDDPVGPVGGAPRGQQDQRFCETEQMRVWGISEWRVKRRARRAPVSANRQNEQVGEGLQPS